MLGAGTEQRISRELRKPVATWDSAMATFKSGDRVRYVGSIDLPSDQKQGDEGTVTWAGDICIGRVTLRDCVRVKWDAVPFQSHVPAHLVEIVAVLPASPNPAEVSGRRRHNRPFGQPVAVRRDPDRTEPEKSGHGQEALGARWAAIFQGGSRMKYLAVIAYLACIPLANWLISTVGTTCVP